MTTRHAITVEINGRTYRGEVEARRRVIVSRMGLENKSVLGATLLSAPTDEHILRVEPTNMYDSAGFCPGLIVVLLLTKSSHRDGQANRP